jgi:ribosomal protein S18 acetylase RimI-like enzyme
VSIIIRAATSDDEDALWMALGQASSPGEEIDARAADHEIRRYLEGWGRDGDYAVVAVDDSRGSVGAAWVRLMSAEDPGYGFVADDIPELGIGILPGYRGQGIGGHLIDALLALSVERFPAVSLSVLDTNDVALRLYASRGFEEVAHDDGAFTMLLKFGAPD